MLELVLHIYILRSEFCPYICMLIDYRSHFKVRIADMFSPDNVGGLFDFTPHSEQDRILK